MIIIPVFIILVIFAGYFIDISKSKFVSSLHDTKLYDKAILKGIISLEILPIIVLLYSLYLIIRQRVKISNYRKYNPINYPDSLWRKFKTFIKYSLTLPKRFFIPQLAYFMLLFWSIGWGLYIYALWTNYESNSNVAELLGYSAMASLDLFLMDINGNILDAIGDTMTDVNVSLLKGCITIIAICSAFCSVFLIVKLFLFKLLSVYHTSRFKIRPTKGNHLYFFWGLNEKSLQLSQTIKNDDPRSIVIYIESTPEIDDETDGINNIINQISPTSSKLSSIDLDEQTIHLTISSEIKDVTKNEDAHAFWSSLGIEEVVELLQALSKNIPVKLMEEGEDDYKNQLHFFFLSENRDKNVLETQAVADNLKCNDSIISIPKYIYCSTRKNGVTSIIEDSCTDEEKNIRTLIIDDALLSIDTLKNKQISHPIRYVDIDYDINPGTIKSSFNSLIIGFGETGRDILRYLYEFGSFLDSNESTKERSPFNCTIIDHDIDKIKGSFISKIPALRNTALNLENENSKIHINFQNYSITEIEYFDYLQKNIHILNYVAIALGDDETNITVATEILKYARQYRENFRHFRIFVRVYNKSSFSHIQDIVKHYNKIIEDEFNVKDVIVLFGDEKEIYKYNIIVKDEFARDGKEYSDTYWKYYEIVDNRIKENKRILGIKEIEKPLSRQEKLDKKKIALFQDRENAIHAITKLYIVGKFLQHHIDDKNKDVWEWLFNLFNVSQENIDSKRKLKSKNVEYTELSNCELPLNQLFTNLAITEHLRWNASHEMLGFVEGINKDYKRKTHSCLKPWDRLDDISDTNAIRLFDYLVVETSLFLKMKKNNLTIDLE